MSAFDVLVAQMDRAVAAALGGERVTYQPAAGDAVHLLGVFDAQYVLAQGDAEAGVEAVSPAVFLRRSDLPVDPELDEPRVTVRGRDYRVTARKPDGLGGIVLLLRERT